MIMKTKTKTGKRNTAKFYALLQQLPGYRKDLQAECKEIEVMDFYMAKYGHCRSTSLSSLSDEEYSELLADMRKRAENSMTRSKWVETKERNYYYNKIFLALSKIGVQVESGYYDEVNYHILRIPISRKRILPAIPTTDLPDLLNAVYGYVDGMKKQQAKEQGLAVVN